MSVDGKELGVLFLKLADLGDEIYSASKILAGTTNLTNMELSLDTKVNEIQVVQKVQILPTADSQGSQTTNEWFKVNNCVQSTKKALKGL